ncbi:MAG: GNAT family N-acetyltransferase [Pseudomonadota bacterium]
MTIAYAVEPELSAEAFVDVLKRSGLAARRPVDEPSRIAAMLRHADLIATARDPDRDGQLVGVSRCITDFAFCCYLSDLAVDTAYQGRGIGSGLIDASRARLDNGCSFFLISAPQAVGFYERLDMPRIDLAFGWLTPAAVT